MQGTESMPSSLHFPFCSCRRFLSSGDEQDDEGDDDTAWCCLIARTSVCRSVGRSVKQADSIHLSLQFEADRVARIAAAEIASCFVVVVAVAVFAVDKVLLVAQRAAGEHHSCLSHSFTPPANSNLDPPEKGRQLSTQEDLAQSRSTIPRFHPPTGKTKTFFSLSDSPLAEFRQQQLLNEEVRKGNLEMNDSPSVCKRFFVHDVKKRTSFT